MWKLLTQLVDALRFGRDGLYKTGCTLGKYIR